MNRGIFAAVVFASAMPLIAQVAAPVAAKADVAAGGKKAVATVNGEVITREQFDILWNRVGTQLKKQYEGSGGKAAFLDNYIKKRLLVQEASKSGFSDRPEIRGDMAASAESTLFDRYVRDVVGSEVVTEKEIRDYYDTHLSEFATPEKVKIRHIVITAQNVGPNRKTREQAHQLADKVNAELRAYIPASGVVTDTEKQQLLIRFQEAARRYSEDGVAEIGGDLGWNARGALDRTFEDAAFSLAPGTMSRVVETGYGFHLILAEAKHEAGTEPYEHARPSIREFMMAKKAADVMAAVSRLTTELRGHSKIATFPEHLED